MKKKKSEFKPTPTEIRIATEKAAGSTSYHKTCFDEYDPNDQKKPEFKPFPSEIRKATEKTVGSYYYHKTWSD